MELQAKARFSELMLIIHECKLSHSCAEPSFPRRRESMVALVDSRLRRNDGSSGYQLIQSFAPAFIASSRIVFNAAASSTELCCVGQPLKCFCVMLDSADNQAESSFKHGM